MMADLNFIPPDQDPESKAAIDAIYKRSMGETAGDISSKTMEDVGGSAGFLGVDKPSMMSRKALSPYGDDSILDAINNRSQRKYDSALRDVGVQSNVKAQSTVSDRMSRASQLLQKEQAYNETIRQMKLKAAQDRRAARAATLGSIMGIGGAAAGGLMGGAPGAMAGMGIGQGVGTMAGNSMGGD